MTAATTAWVTMLLESGLHHMEVLVPLLFL